MKLKAKAGLAHTNLRLVTYCFCISWWNWWVLYAVETSGEKENTGRNLRIVEAFSRKIPYDLTQG
jgi:hypothetical protein